MKTLIKILCLSVVLLNTTYSATDYLSNFPIKNNLNGININLTTWKWHPNQSEWRKNQPWNENWLYLSYYINSKYSINMLYVNYKNDLSYLKDRYSIEASYNKIIFKKLISRNGLIINNNLKFKLNSTISFENNIISDFLKFNYLLGFEYLQSNKEFNLINCITLSLPSSNNSFEFFINYWRKNKKSDDFNYIGLGINVFIH